MKAQTALVLGATGLIGTHLLKILLADEAFEKVIVLVRKQLEIQHPKLVVQQVNLNDPADFQNKLIGGDAIFCCIGTTMKKVKGDKSTYRKIDFDIAVNAAKFGLVAGYEKYVLVSSVGANAASNNFYLQLKGEVENAIAALNYKAFHIFQPSILLGERAERRPAEMIAQGIMEATSVLFFGKYAKYKAIKAESVAKAMVKASKKEEEGKFVYTYQQIKKLGKQ